MDMIVLENMKEQKGEERENSVEDYVSVEEWSGCFLFFFFRGV